MSMDNKNLIIVGAGSFSKVATTIAKQMNYNIIGYLDDNIAEGTLINNEATVLGGFDKLSFNKLKDAEFIIAIGNNDIRKQIAEKAKVKWATLVDNNAVIYESLSIGEGTIICAGAIVSVNVTIGNHTIINPCIIDHDCKIEDYVCVGSGAVCGSNSKINELVNVQMGTIVNKGSEVHN